MAAKPIIFGQRTVGAIAIKLSKEPLKQKIAAVRSQGLIIAAVAGSGGILLALFISHSLTVPLNQLIKATHRITTGNLSYRIHLKNKDEFFFVS